MAQENSNSTMEMGTSDQVLVSTKKKNFTFLIGGVAMVVVIAVVVTLVVLLSGNEGGVAAPVGTTEGPTTPELQPTSAPTTTTTVTETTSTTTTSTEPPTETPPDDLIELEDIINGVYAAPSFNATWSSGSEVLYRNSFGDLVLYDVVTDTTTPLVQNTSEILQQSSRVTLQSPDGSHVVLSYNVVPVYRYSFLARYAAIDVTTQDATDITPPGVPSNEAFLQNFVWAPQGTACAFVYLNNIYYKANLSSAAEQLTTTGQLNVLYNGIPDWVYEEEVFVSSNALWFSGDGRRLAYVTFDDSQVRVMRVPHYGVPGSVDYQYTQHHEIRYPKAGTTNPAVYVTLADLTAGTSTLYSAPSSLHQPILKTVSFVTNSSIALMWTNRVQSSMMVELCEEGQTVCTEIYSYSEADGWIDNIPLIFNEEGNAFITILPQTVDGERYKQIVQVSRAEDAAVWSAEDRSNTAHTVTDILRWTADDHVWYRATAVNDSSELHVYRSARDRTLSCFSCAVRRPDGAACLYNEAALSTAGDLLTLTCAGPRVPHILIYNTEGTLVRSWDSSEAISSLLGVGQVPATLRLSVPVGTGLPAADVHIQVPADYANRTDVPLLVYMYAGPDTALVTQQWTVDWGTSLVSRWGIAVAHIDARGSGLRGVDNMFAVNRRLGSVEVEDQIAVTRYLQENLPWVDGNRTCAWGWSYGGYAASLSLARGGAVFRCAVAVAPVVDWRYYDTIYTERYMDTPQNNTQGYTDSSLLSEQTVEAFRNKRYFLVHGTADDNVHYQHAMLLSRLLQRRDVYFTQMSYTDEDHGLVGVRPHLYHGLEKFLRENML